MRAFHTRPPLTYFSSVTVSPRKSSRKLDIRGVYTKARVTRGPHWKWSNDDGRGLGLLFCKLCIENTENTYLPIMFSISKT